MKCFYHVDLDGFCSAAIVRKVFPECELFPINYGWDFPFDTIEENEIVYVVDFTLEPIDQLIKLHKICGDNLFWIDHHESALNLEKKHQLQDINGVRESGKSGCELTWNFMIGGPRPDAVHHLGRWDVWDHDDKDTVPFNSGMTARNSYPEKPIWEILLDQSDKTSRLVATIIEEGKVVMRYEKLLHKRIVRSVGYSIDWNGYKAAIVNRSYLTTTFFNDIKNYNDYDLFIWWWYSRGEYQVRVTTVKDDIDVGRMCTDRNGGGHRKIGGFQVKDISEFLK